MVQGYSGHASYNGGLDVARKVLKADGIKGLYRGFGLSVMTYSPSSAVWWASYGSSQRIIWKWVLGSVNANLLQVYNHHCSWHCKKVLFNGGVHLLFTNIREYLFLELICVLQFVRSWNWEQWTCSQTVDHSFSSSCWRNFGWGYSILHHNSIGHYKDSVTGTTSWSL